MGVMVKSNRRVVTISKRKVGFVFVIMLVALTLWFGRSFYTQVLRKRIDSYDQNTTGMMIGKPESVSIGGSVANSTPKVMPDSYRYDQKIPVNDSREFLKTNYSAVIKTRDVQSVVSSAKNIVKGNDGRVDSISSSELSGYLSFVVPKSKYEAFRTEIEALTHKRLFSETNTSDNLLGQKQSIEQQTSNILKNLETLNEQKESLILRHNQSAAVINKELQGIRTELASIRKQISETTDTDVLNSLRSQESAYVSRETTQKQKLSSENSQYAAQIANLDSQIKNQNNNLENVNTQDTKFTENVETVEGRIDVRWISIWQMIKIFSPISPEILIIVLVFIAWNIMARLNYVPRFVLE